MKANIILILLIAVLTTACKTDKTRDFIPGTYVNHAEGEYSTASDTLVIEPSESNNFVVHRKTAFQRITNGKAGKPEYETKEWNAIYDEATKSLNETSKGKLITFYPETGRLMIGKREYTKIN